LLLAAFLSLFYCSYSNAQTVYTKDQLDPSAQNWSGQYGTGYWQGQGGPDPNRIPDDTGFVWSSGSNVISTTIAINQALKNARVQVNGFTYKWKVKNGNGNLFGNQPGTDDFIITVDVYDSNGNIYSTYQYDYSYQHNWTTHTGSETFVDPFLPPSYFSDIIVSAQGSDSAGWAGHYGPEFNVTDSELDLTFSTNPCYNNPLYDPQCQGYANALFNQQCTANPLYDPSCSGYVTTQCAANPLYSTSCPGYTQAFFSQQCTSNPKSNPSCPDYYIAMCTDDPLFDPGCIGYDTAYFNQQCSLDPQYSQTCPGYVDLSGNDGDFAVLDPIVDDVVNYDSDIGTELAITAIVAPAVIAENTIVNSDDVERSTGFQTIEDDIETEISDLQSMDGETILEEDIEAEIAKLENESGTSSTEDGESLTGKANMDDNIEKELAELENAKPKYVEKIPGKAMPKVDPADSKRNKLRLLIAMKAIEAVKELEAAVTLEQQMNIQRRLLALISFVPDFNNYSKEENIDLANFYPPKPTVDHAFARWFLNDPNFKTMEDLQYTGLK